MKAAILRRPPPAPAPTTPAPSPAPSSTADLVASIEVAPSTVAVGASAVWTFGVAHRSEASVARTSRYAPSSFRTRRFRSTSRVTSAARCRPLAPRPLSTATFGPLSPNASASVRIASAGSRTGEVRGTVTVSIIDRTPVDGASDNNVATRRAHDRRAASAGGRSSCCRPRTAARARQATLDGDGTTDLAVVSRRKRAAL